MKGNNRFKFRAFHHKTLTSWRGGEQGSTGRGRVNIGHLRRIIDGHSTERGNRLGRCGRHFEIDLKGWWWIERAETCCCSIGLDWNITFGFYIEK